MRLTGARAYARPSPTPTMPPGLVELMEGLAKDVLRNNPENVYEFCAGHMQKLLEIRDGPPPPKKQLSLEQKITNAQEKIKQRMKNRQNQNDGILPEYTNENHDLEDKLCDKEIPIENTSVTHPVITHGEKTMMAKEVEIFHEPDAVITTNNTSTDEASKPVHDDLHIDKAPEISHKLEEDVLVATQKLEPEDSTEKMSEKVKESLTVVTDQMSNEAVSKKTNGLNVDVESKDALGSNFDNIEYVDNISQVTNNEEVQLNVSEPTVSEQGDTTKEKNYNLDVTKDDSYERASIPPAAIITDVVSSHIEDDKTIASDVVEKQQKNIKENLKHDPILMEDDKPDNRIEPEDVVNDNLKQQNIVDNEASPDIQHDVKEEPSAIQRDIALIEKDDDNIESKENKNNAVNENKEEESIDQSQDSTNLQPQTEETIGRELTINQIESSHETNLLPENQNDPSDGVVTLKILNSHVSESGAESMENQVITVEIAETDTTSHSFKNDVINHDDVDKNQVNYVPKENKELIDNPEKRPEQEWTNYEESNVKHSANIQDNTNTLNKKEAIVDNDETPESIAVSGMDLETAAITIQKVFRTFLFSKSRASTLDDTVNENSLDENIEKKEEPEYVLSSSNLNKERRTLGISRMDTVLQTVNEEKSLSLSDDSSLSSAATTIQAHVRGFLVRNRLASNKTASSSSLVNSDGPSTLSLDGDVNEPKKTILNIHIVPERGQFMSRDESLLTSIDLPLDNSPPSSVNLHPLGYDKSAERRKQLKREDAVQSISPPSNSSGKQSEEVDSVKDALNYSVDVKSEADFVNAHDKPLDADTESCDTTLTISSTAETVVDADTYNPREVLSSPEHNVKTDNRSQEVVTNSSSDEMDVVTPYATIPEKTANSVQVDTENDEKPKLVHSGEFHDLVVQTQVKRSESSVVREFKNVLVYFLLWDKA